jgi:hypothetical protein
MSGFVKSKPGARERDLETRTVRRNRPEKPFERRTQTRTGTGRFWKKRKLFLFVTIPRLERPQALGS